MNDAYLSGVIGAIIGALTIRVMDYLCSRAPGTPLAGNWVLMVKDGKEQWIEVTEIPSTPG